MYVEVGRGGQFIDILEWHRERYWAKFNSIRTQTKGDFLQNWSELVEGFYPTWH